MRRAAFVLCGTVLAACSGKDPGVSAAAQAPSASAKPTDAGECIDEFVQVFEQSTDQAAPASTENLCFDGADANGPPKFPSASRKITLEYRQGDYLATDERATWAIGDFDAKRRCTVAVLMHTKIVARNKGGVKESTRLDNGKLARSSATGEDYGSSIPLGAGPSQMMMMLAGQSAATESKQESTAFGVDCTRAGPAAGQNVTMCSVTQPRKCASTRVLLPIDIRGPAATGGTQTGKTTALRVGKTVDPASWELP